MVLSGCGVGGVLGNAACVLGCTSGYAAAGSIAGTCEANAGTSTASYQGQSVTCTAARCGAPSVSLPQTVISGCEANGAMGSSNCMLGCASGYFASDAATGTCLADSGLETASYQGQAVTCTVCDDIANCAGQVTCSSADNEVCSACAAGFAGQQCQHSGDSTCGGAGEAQGDGSCVCDDGYSGAACEVAATCDEPTIMAPAVAGSCAPCGVMCRGAGVRVRQD